MATSEFQDQDVYPSYLHKEQRNTTYNSIHVQFCQLFLLFAVPLPCFPTPSSTSKLHQSIYAFLVLSQQHTLYLEL